MYTRAPLDDAARTGDTKRVNFLLRHGADPNEAISGGESAIQTALRLGNVTAVMNLLLDADAKHGDMSPSLLYMAAYFGHVGALQLCQEVGDACGRKDEGWKPLHVAVQNKRSPAVIAALLRLGADVEARTPQGYTPLLLASGVGELQTVKLLVGFGADISATDYTGHTALHSAAARCRPLVIHTLLGAGADATASDARNRTPSDVLGTVVCPSCNCMDPMEVDASKRELLRAPAFGACSWMWPSNDGARSVSRSQVRRAMPVVHVYRIARASGTQGEKKCWLFLGTRRCQCCTAQWSCP